MERGISVADAVNRYCLGGHVFQEIMPDEDLVIQGSLSYSSNGLTLEFCLLRNVTFREAMAQAQTVMGLGANFTLRQFVDPSSLDDLFFLIRRFPNSVIEFATYRRPVGVWPHRCTVIFEVREY